MNWRLLQVTALGLGGLAANCQPATKTPGTLTEYKDCKWETDPHDATKQIFVCVGPNGERVIVDTTGVGGGRPQ